MYQRFFTSQSLDNFSTSKYEKNFNAVKMHRTLLNGKSLIKNSSYQVRYFHIKLQVDFLPHAVTSTSHRKTEEEFQINPNNPKKLSSNTGLKFCSLSSYNLNFHQHIKDDLPPIKWKTENLYPGSFLGKSTYQENFKKVDLSAKATQIVPKYFIEIILF